MRMLWCSILVIFTGLFAFAREPDGLEPWDFVVDGVSRSALVWIPEEAKGKQTPVIFVFHGHGGSAGQAARSFALERQWPEAICVYMQGLKTPGLLTDPKGKRTGWQWSAGDQKDRDIKFFDAALNRLKRECMVDQRRIYATGHSNGGAFTYLLWLMRADVVAAVAPSAAAARYVRQLAPKPALIIGGRNDRLVKFEWQERTINIVRKNNGCAESGEIWEKVCTLYPSKGGTPLVTYISGGGHRFESAAPFLIAEFFKDVSSGWGVK